MVASLTGGATVPEETSAGEAACVTDALARHRAERTALWRLPLGERAYRRLRARASNNALRAAQLRTQ